MIKTKSGLLFDESNSIVNQILPSKHPFAWKLYNDSRKNNWVPSEAKMQDDVTQWGNGTLDDDEKLAYKRFIGFFAGSESLVSNNLLMRIFGFITDAECRNYLLLQGMEESNHNVTIVYICDSLGLDIKEIYEAYERIPAIKAKDDFLAQIITDPKKDLTNEEKLRIMIIFYLICEGLFFYIGFAALINFGRQNKMPATAKQMVWSLRDEANHVEFGTYAINTVIRQYPEIWTPELKSEVKKWFDKAVELEVEYFDDVLPNGIIGMNRNSAMQYVKHLAGIRLSSIGIESEYDKFENPFTWLAEASDLRRQDNFFEQTVTEYASGDLEW